MTIPMGKNEIKLYLTAYAKINSRWIKDESMKKQNY